MTTVRATTWRRRLWIWTVVAGITVIAAFHVLREWSGDAVVADAIVSGVSLLAAAGIAAGILVHRPARPLPWLLLAAGQFAFTVADVLHLTHAAGDEFPSVVDAFYLSQFPLVIVALGVIIRRRTPGWHAPTWIDSAVLATAGALVWWLYGIEPAMQVDLSPAAQAVAVVYPVFDLLLLATATRLMVGGGGRSGSFRLLVGSLIVLMIADSGYALLTAAGSSAPGYWMNGLWLMSYVLGAAAALHPSMRMLDARAAVPAPGATAMRLAMLAAASLLAPVVLLVEYVRTDNQSHEPAIALACMLLFLLVLARMSGLVSVQRTTAITDALTGLHTRGFLNDVLAAECVRERRGGEPVGLIIADADHFKSVNDTYGHPAGDEVLAEIGRRLGSVIRPGDTIARFGGEEFAVLLPGAGPAEVAVIGERVRRVVADRPVTVDGDTDLAVTVSVGAASLGAWKAGPGSAPGRPQVLVRAADQALYAAKRDGRNRVVAADLVAA